MAQIYSFGAGTETANAPSSTGAEITYPSVNQPYASGPRSRHLVITFGWCQFTTPPSATTVVPRIRSNIGVLNPIVGEANAENLKAAAGSTEPFFILVAEEVAAFGSNQYGSTFKDNSLVDNGTFLQGSVAAFVL